MSDKSPVRMMVQGAPTLGWYDWTTSTASVIRERAGPVEGGVEKVADMSGILMLVSLSVTRLL